jgi:RNA polymerase sigma-70 factor (ECF subfamily)
MDSFTHDIEEKELLTRLHNSDETAFTQIYNYYWKKLFFLAAQKLNNFSEAEEIVQDIFLDVWKRREEICVTNGLSAYLSASVKYKVINLLAKRNQQLRYQQHHSSLQSFSDLSTQQHLGVEELKKELSKETAKLPEKCRLVFQMSREQGFPQKTIAEKLSISEKTVEAHLSKALRTLRMNLSQFLTALF